MKKRTIMYIGIPILLLILMAVSAIGAISLSNARSILFATDYAWLWLNVSLRLLAVIAVMVLLKFLKKYDLNKAIALFAVLVLLSVTASAAVYFNNRRYDSWFYDLEEQLTAKYSSVESVGLSLDRWGPTLIIECDQLDLPSESDAIVKDIKEILRIGEDNIFKSSYTGRSDQIDSEFDLDFNVCIYVSDERIEYSTGYYLGYDHTENGTIDQYRTWRRDYNDETVEASGERWFDN